MSREGRQQLRGTRSYWPLIGTIIVFAAAGTLVLAAVNAPWSGSATSVLSLSGVIVGAVATLTAERQYRRIRADDFERARKTFLERSVASGGGRPEWYQGIWLREVTPAGTEDPDLRFSDRMLLEELTVGGAKVVLILGTPGTGKSVLLHMLAGQLARRSVEGQGDAVPTPVVVSARTWLLSGRSLREALSQEIRVPEAMLDAWSTAGSGMTIFVDGLDEVPEGQQLSAAAQLRDFIAHHPNTRIVATSRHPNTHVSEILKPSRTLSIETLSDSDAFSLFQRLLAAQAVTLPNEVMPTARTPLALWLEAAWRASSDRPASPTQQALVEHFLASALREGGSPGAERSMRDLLRLLPSESSAPAAQELVKRLAAVGSQAAAERAQNVALTHFDTATHGETSTSDRFTDDERAVLSVLSSDLSQDLAQVASRAKMPPSRVSTALKSLTDSAAVAAIRVNDGPTRYRRMAMGDFQEGAV